MLPKVVAMVESDLVGASTGLVLDYLAFESNSDLAGPRQRLLQEGYAYSRRDTTWSCTLQIFCSQDWPGGTCARGVYRFYVNHCRNPLAHDIFTHKDKGRSRPEGSVRRIATGRKAGQLEKQSCAQALPLTSLLAVA